MQNIKVQQLPGPCGFFFISTIEESHILSEYVCSKMREASPIAPLLHFMGKDQVGNSFVDCDGLMVVKLYNPTWQVAGEPLT